MIEVVKKWIFRYYLNTIKFSHLILVTLLGVWPCYYDYNTKSYKTTWYLRFYSLTILASIIALLVNTSITLYEDVNRAHPSDTGSIVGTTLSSAIVLAVVMIYLIQIVKVEQINTVIEDGKILFEEICSPITDTDTDIDWSEFLTKFTIYILLNGSLMCHMTIRRFSFLSPKADADFSLIFFYSIPNIILSVMVSVFFCGVSILDKCFCILNHQLTKIADDKTFDTFLCARRCPNYQRMTQFCSLSDKIDTISKLHFKLCKLTKDFCDVLAMQFLVCNTFTVMLWIFKLFLDFLIIRKCIENKEYLKLPILVWIAGLNIATSIIDLSSVAGVCSKIKSKVSLYFHQYNVHFIRATFYFTNHCIADVDGSQIFLMKPFLRHQIVVQLQISKSAHQYEYQLWRPMTK